jgi:transcriptional regulator with XRE-family HTH domain
MSDQEKVWTVSERFGANLMWFRCKARVSRQELADWIGMDRAQVWALEQGFRIPCLDTILKLAAGLGISPCELIAWIWWDPAQRYHYETPPSIAAKSGYEVVDFELPAGFRVSRIGYETEEEFKARLKERIEEDRPLLDLLLRDDTPPLPPRERPDAAWVLRTGQALKSLREERGLTHDQLAERARTTATFIRRMEEGEIGDPGLRILREICRALDGEGSELAAQLESVRAARKAAAQKVLGELAGHNSHLAEEKE